MKVSSLVKAIVHTCNPWTYTHLDMKCIR